MESKRVEIAGVNVRSLQLGAAGLALFMAGLWLGSPDDKPSFEKQGPSLASQYKSQSESRPEEAPQPRPRPEPTKLDPTRLRDCDDIGCEEHEESVDRSIWLVNDERLLREAVRAMGTVKDRESLENLAATVGEVNTPEVESAMLELCRSGGLPLQRAAAFQVLESLQTPAALDASLKALSEETDHEVRRSALGAIPAASGADQRSARKVLNLARHVLRKDNDAECRRLAALLITEWRLDSGDLDPVLKALGEDADPGVRAGCAFALELARDRSRRVIAKLTEVLRKQKEDMLVRENCFNALSRLGPLPPVARQAWTSFYQFQDALAEEASIPSNFPSDEPAGSDAAGSSDDGAVG